MEAHVIVTLSISAIVLISFILLCVWIEYDTNKRLRNIYFGDRELSSQSEIIENHGGNNGT